MVDRCKQNMFRIQMCNLKLVLVCLLALFSSSPALENGLARTPPMGWLSWTRFGCNTNCASDPDFCLSEKLIMQMADHMVSDGYLAAGYEYVCLDDCWLAGERDVFHRLQPDPIRFPNGMKNLSDYVHSKGMKIGIYEDFGTKTCAGYPGSEFYLETDAKTFAEWGIDLLKFDTCNSNALDNKYGLKMGIYEDFGTKTCAGFPGSEFYLELDAKTFADWGIDYLKLDDCHSDSHDNKYGYPAMSMYLNQTGRPILFSCEWPYGELQQNKTEDYGPVREYCNIWRNYWDVNDDFKSVTGIVNYYGKNNELFKKFSGPGGFFDPDMILAGGFGTSHYQQRAQMAMWAMFSAPLIMSNDLRDISVEAHDLLVNPYLIAVDQDPLGTMATKLWEFNKLQVWVKPIYPNGSLAVTIFNPNSYGSGTPIDSTIDSFALTDPRGYNITEVFTKKNIGVFKPGSKLVTRVFPNDAYMIIAKIMS